MPVPQLPLEVVDLVLDQCIRGYPNFMETFIECGPLALVCASWTPYVRRHAFRDIDLVVGRDDSLIDHLVAFPHLFAYVRRLWMHQTADGYQDTMSDVWAGRQNRPPGGPTLYDRRVLDLLPRCPRLSAFAFETYAFSTLEPIIKGLSDRRHLRHLEFRIFAGNSSHTAAIGSILAKHLDTLDLLSIQFRLLQEERWVAETAPPERLLRVKDLRVPHLTEGPADPLMRRFLDYIDGSSVYAFNADIQEARSQVLEWVATQSRRLVNLRLFTNPSAFLANRSALHRFKNVIWLNIHDVNVDTSSSTFAHGMSLPAFLDHLPLHFCGAYVAPWAFDVPPDFAHVPNTRFVLLDGPTVTVSRRIVDEHGKAGTARLDLVKKRGADGVVAWHTASAILTPLATSHEAWTTAFFCSPSLNLEPFKHPAMPVPYLPLELVDLIISHVAQGLEPESPDLLYSLCDDIAELRNLEIVCLNRDGEDGVVYTPEDAPPHAVRLEVLLRRMPPKLQSVVFSGWPILVDFPDVFIRFNCGLPYVRVQTTSSDSDLAVFHKVVVQGQVRWAIPLYRVAELTVAEDGLLHSATLLHHPAL